MKVITMGKEARDKIKAGVDKLANLVKSTLGPGGTNVILELGHLHVITKDGVSVAQEVFLEDALENMGAQIVKKVAQKTVQEAGDGTTTATVLAQAILNEGIKTMTGGSNIIDVKRGLDKAVIAVVKSLRALSTQVTPEDLHKVAIISSNGDREIGKYVGDAIKEVGIEGIVTVESSNSLDTWLKKVDGMRFDRGYMSPYFITNPDRAESDLKNPLILIYDGNLASVKEIAGDGKSTNNLISRLRGSVQSKPVDPELAGRPLLIIAQDFSAEFVSTMAVNAKNKAIVCCLVQAPDFGDSRKSIMYDIAAMTGATVITKDAGLTLKDAHPEHLGQSGGARITQWNTTIVDGVGGLTASVRINEIREQMKEAKDHVLESLKSRLARLQNGLMVIYVGGASDIEVQEKKDRIDDSLNATRAAVEEGVIPGGGVGYVRAGQKTEWTNIEIENADEATGVEIIRRILEVPFLTIVDNVGKKSSTVLKKVLDNHSTTFGFNAATLQYEDLVESGVIDPVKVSRLALENAASVAGMLLTTNGVVSNKR